MGRLLALTVQEAFRSTRYYFTFNLIPPLYFLTFENRSRSCREETEILLTLRGVGCGKENIIEQRGVDDKGFLFLN